MWNAPRSSSEGTAACLRTDAAASGMSLLGSVQAREPMRLWLGYGMRRPPRLSALTVRDGRARAESARAHQDGKEGQTRH
jgi:hypothetical protein